MAKDTPDSPKGDFSQGDFALDEAARLARRRFYLLSVARLVGVLVAMGGFVVVSGKVVLFGGMVDKWLGGIAVLIGMVGFAYVPVHLARHWKCKLSLQPELETSRFSESSSEERERS